VREVAQAAAIRHAVVTQGYLTRRRRARFDDVVACIEHLGCVQIDAISTVDRTQRLVLAARCGKLEPGMHDALLRSGRVYEYWAHEACLLPARDHRFHRAEMRRHADQPRMLRHLRDHATLRDTILATARERGPISSRDFGGAGQGYWDWTPAKRMLDSLWTIGELAIAGRRGVERMYDLPERVLPDAALGAPEPSEPERLRELVRRTVLARGLVREARLYDYFRLAGGRARLQMHADAVVDDHVCERVRIAETGDTALVPAGQGELIEAAAPRGAHLLSPFDNLIWDRLELRALWQFDHALEIYKPAPKRVWGYYVLPLLDGAKLVGRVDAKADRKAGTMRALRVHWERRPRPRALSEALARLAWLLGLPDMEVHDGLRDTSDTRGTGA
jgi:uncharacterized protein